MTTSTLFDVLPEEVLQVEILPYLNEEDLLYARCVSTYFKDNVTARFRDIEEIQLAEIVAYKQYFEEQRDYLHDKWGMSANEPRIAESSEDSLGTLGKLIQEMMTDAPHSSVPTPDKEGNIVFDFKWNDTDLSALTCKNCIKNIDADRMKQSLTPASREIIDFIRKHGPLFEDFDPHELQQHSSFSGGGIFRELARTQFCSLQKLCIVEIFCYGKKFLLQRSYAGNGGCPGPQMYGIELFQELFSQRARWGPTYTGNSEVAERLFNTHARVVAMTTFSSNLFATALMLYWVAPQVQGFLSNTPTNPYQSYTAWLSKALGTGEQEFRTCKRLVLHALLCLREANNMNVEEDDYWSPRTLFPPEAIYLLALLWYPNLPMRHPRLQEWLSGNLVRFWLRPVKHETGEHRLPRDSESLFTLLKERTSRLVEVCCSNTRMREGLQRAVLQLTNHVEQAGTGERLIEPLDLKKVFLHHFAERRECSLLFATMETLTSSQKMALRTSIDGHDNTLLHAACRSCGLVQGVLCIVRDSLFFPLHDDETAAENSRKWEEFAALRNKDGKTAAELLSNRMRKKVMKLLPLT